MARDTAPAMRPVTPSSEGPNANPLKGIAEGAARRLGGAAMRATGAGGILLDSTGPAGKARETGTTAQGDRVIVDERTIDVRHADGTRQQGFLNPDGKSWSSGDGTLIARLNAIGAIEIAPPRAGGNDSGAEKEKPAGTDKEKPAPEPGPDPHRSSETRPADECRQIGKVPPSEADIQRLIAEHNQSGERLTHAASTSIIEQTQPDNTRVVIAGAGVPGPDITYKCGSETVDTVQVKAVARFKGFTNETRKELAKKPGDASRVIAFQVPVGTKDTDKWMSRYWGNRIKAEPDNWKDDAARHQGREILIVDTTGKALYRGPVYDPLKAAPR